MKTLLFIALAAAMVILLATAGCTRQAVQPTPTPTPLPTTVPATNLTTVQTPVPTTPVPVTTTVTPAVPLPVIIRDTQLLFTISAPDGYAGTTIRIPTTDYSSVFKTTIYNPAAGGANRTIDDNSGNYTVLADSLTIFSYSSSLSVDQSIRNLIRNSGAVFNESTATYNGITYTRFDASRNPYDGMPGGTIVFVGNKGSANEKGFLPVLFYTMTPDDTLSQATYEDMVMSFRYYTSRTIGDAPGKETDRPSFYQ
jgi:hypothetical protein